MRLALPIRSNLVLDAGALNGFATSISSLALVAVLAYLSARLFWLLVSGLSTEAPLAATGLTTPPNGGVYDYSILQRVTPFDRKDSASTVAASPSQDAPETQLSLTLHGLRTANDGEGIAVISGEGGAQGRYRIGDAIEGVNGASLERVYADGVLLLRNGRVERLPINPDEGQSSIQTVAEFNAAAASNASVDERDNAEPSNRAQQTATEPIKNGLASLSRAELVQLFQTLRFEDAPQSSQGGVMVFPISSVGPFKKSGMRPRDIVQSISGVTLDANTDYAELLKELNATDEAIVSLLRNEQRWRLRIKITE